MSHFHHHHQHLQLEKRDLQTVVSVVYVTASPTFTGAIGGYITLDGSQTTATQNSHPAKGTPLQNSQAAASSAPSSATQKNGAQKGTPIQAASSTPSSTDDSSSSTFNGVQPSRQQRPVPSTSDASSAFETPSTSVLPSSALPTSAAVPTSAALLQSTTLISSVIPATAIAAVSSTASSSPSATASPVAHATEGTSGGAKAGIAIGVILALAIIAGLIFFFVRRKRSNDNDSHNEIANEKMGGRSPTTTRNSQSSASSSRFSLTKSVLNVPMPRLSLGPIISEKQQEQRPGSGSRMNTNDSITNPFGDHAEAKDVLTDAQIKSIVSSQIPAPLNVKSDRPISPNMPPPATTARPVSPPTNVHRVQLDFKPSMDDELELRSGEVIRLLHEYDDGWALCKRLDGTQQGVVPRSCLSKLPLKKREGPPPNRRAGPPGHPANRAASGGSVSSINSFASAESVPRPLSPAGRVRAQSSASSGGPGPMKQVSGNEVNRQRASTVSEAGKVLSPLNPASNGTMGRKPVPGQAM